jgi:hypothetical protein
MAVSGGKPGLRQRGFEPALDEAPPGAPPQEAQCNFSWFFAAQRL